MLEAELLGAPTRWRTGEVRAAKRSETHGRGLAAYDESFVEEPDLARDYSKGPVRIAPGEESPIYYLVRAEAVASPVSGRAEGCRITYRTGNRIHAQSLLAPFEALGTEVRRHQSSGGRTIARSGRYSKPRPACAARPVQPAREAQAARSHHATAVPSSSTIRVGIASRATPSIVVAGATWAPPNRPASSP